MPVAAVSGANRGIGLEVVRQLAGHGFDVVLGSRDAARGEAARVSLGDDVAARVRVAALDVTDVDGVERFADALDALDVLVNNAAIHYDTWESAAGAELGVVREAFETNVLGAWRLTQACLPLLRASAHPRVVMVSSEAGSLAGMRGGTPAYRVSKTALHALTRMLAAELRGDGVLVNAVCPGWTATDMGGAGGRPVRDGARSVVWAALLGDDGPTGGFFRDGRELPW
jgi:NAD(P)-dependent dehydrogenase (short-subunit alcohol dehydrogenase family)